MKDKPRAVTTADLAAFEQSTAEAFAIVLGLLAEATDTQHLTYQLGAALHAAETNRPDAVRDRLLDRAFRTVLVKALNAAPDDPVLQSLAASVSARRAKH